MRRAKLLVVLLGLFTLSATGCGDTQKPAEKNKPATPAKKPAEGSGSN